MYMYIGCSHSFCGICLVRDMDHFQSKDIDVVVTCPSCREEIDSEPTFERTLDDIITKKVNLVHNCEAKEDWNLRRNDHKEYRKILKDKKSQGEEDDNSNDFYNDILEAVIPTVCIIIMLIAVLRRAAFF